MTKMNGSKIDGQDVDAKMAKYTSDVGVIVGVVEK